MWLEFSATELFPKILLTIGSKEFLVFQRKHIYMYKEKVYLPYF